MNLESHNQVGLDYSDRMSVCMSIGFNSSNGCLSVCLNVNIRQSTEVGQPIDVI